MKRYGGVDVYGSTHANPLETLMKLRGCVEFRDKERMLSEIHALRTERRL
jgi:hypothetical protein